ncbi:RNA processing protein [Scheffersomyces coipomensis]|uniref:RNA processing protein n=1 Tax=Scheffersomyces coipomensis TaxID=1788519 RepID=UPI00315CB424
MSTTPQGEVFCGGATTSQHVEAQDDDHFENTTFKLKRTRSMGLLDEFIAPLQSTDDNTTDNNIVSSSHHELPSSQSQLQAQPQQPNLTVDTSSSKLISESNENDNILPRSSSLSPPQAQTPTLSALQLESPSLIPHDDTDIATEPWRHVDYLSHQWDVSDISKSWRYVIQKRKDVADSARLENASWRTWAQRRSNLKTISPEVVNWSKDSDVTWLYGPILKDDSPSLSSSPKKDHHFHNTRHQSIASNSVAGDISIPNPNAPKPILKRRTVEDMMISHSNLLKLSMASNKVYQKTREQIQQQRHKENIEEDEKNANDTPDFADYDAISAKLNTQYNGQRSNSGSISKLQDLLNDPNNSHHSSSSSNVNISTPLFRGTDSNENASTLSIDTIVLNSSTKSALSNDRVNDSIDSSFNTSPLIAATSIDSNKVNSGEPVSISPPQPSKEIRHIHFNDEVQQCMAIENFSDDEGNEYNSYDENDDQGLDYDYDTDMSGYRSSKYRNHSPYTSDFDNDDDDDDDEEEEGFVLNVKSPSLSASTILPSLGNNQSNLNNNSNQENTEDNESISTDTSKLYRTRSIVLLPSTSLNYGSDEESDEENPYTSSLSHNVNNEISRGYDYYYDYNTVYTIDPNHAIYGNKKETPDVIDVPELIGIGSNFDYDYDTSNIVPIINPTIINNNNINIKTTPNLSTSTSPTLSSTSGSVPVPIPMPVSIPVPVPSGIPSRPPVSNPFQLSDDEGGSSDEDDDFGLSINTRSSSQSLAQQAFGHQTMTAHYPETFENPEPTNIPVSMINPHHSSASLSKQPHSSGSLSQSFFGDSSVGGLTKQKPSSSALSDQFFNSASAISPPATVGSNVQQLDRVAFSPSPDNSLQRTLSNTQKKSSPLPPQTTSENAFSENLTPPPGQPVLEQAYQNETIVQQPQSKNTFSFDDSDSESEDDFISAASSSIKRPPLQGKSSYATLAEVANQNGFGSNNQSPEVGQATVDDSVHPSLVGQAKGLANQFLGGWKNNASPSDSS